MKFIHTIAVVLALSIVGCKKEETATPPAQSQSAYTTAPVPTPPAISAPVEKSPVQPATTVAPPPKSVRTDEAKAALEQMLQQWQGGTMPAELHDVALLTQNAGVPYKLLDFKVNAIRPPEPPGKVYKGTANLTIEGRGVMQVKVFVLDQGGGKWTANISK